MPMPKGGCCPWQADAATASLELSTATHGAGGQLQSEEVKLMNIAMTLMNCLLGETSTGCHLQSLCMALN